MGHDFHLELGLIFKSLSETGLKKAPQTFQTAHTMKEVEADILIFGSSRADRHYVSSIISDSLNKTVFNCGLDEQGFYYGMAMIHAVLKRYSPETVILDFEPRMLNSKAHLSNFGKFNELYPYYDDDNFYKEIIILEDANNRYKMLSQMYRYNSNFIYLARSLFLANSGDNKFYDNGYDPIPINGYNYPSLVHGKYKVNDLVDKDKADGLLDTNKIDFLMRIIENCNQNNVDMIFSVSPRFQESNVTEVSSYIYMENLLEDNNIPLIYMGDNTVINDSTMYKDLLHLNNKGAVAFTKAFVGRLKDEMR